MAGEKTEAPTPRKLEDARKKGNVSKSQDLVSVGVLLTVVLAMRFLAPRLWNELRAIVTEALATADRPELTPDAVMGMTRDFGLRALLALLPLLAIMAAAGILLNLSQTGLLLSTHSLKPKFSAISPASNLKRIFSPDGAVNLAKAFSKMGIIGVVVWLTMRSQMAQLATMAQLSVPQSLATLAALAFDISIRAAGALFILAVADYAWQRRRWRGRLRMTKQEVRQEFRESDGDPQIKAAIRRRRQQLLNRMISAVPRADVVVTNPTHYAVALRYDPVTMQAPIVVAKGERLVAQRIKEVARKAGVPVLEEPPLARALYAACPVGGHIPANLFRAVAEVLAWVYALKQRPAGTRVPFRAQEAI